MDFFLAGKVPVHHLSVRVQGFERRGVLKSLAGLEKSLGQQQLVRRVLEALVVVATLLRSQILSVVAVGLVANVEHLH